jgi:hypothetical protein
VRHAKLNKAEYLDREPALKADCVMAQSKVGLGNTKSKKVAPQVTKPVLLNICVCKCLRGQAFFFALKRGFVLDLVLAALMAGVENARKRLPASVFPAPAQNRNNSKQRTDVQLTKSKSSAREKEKRKWQRNVKLQLKILMVLVCAI